jgi:hypothetical protein
MGVRIRLLLLYWLDEEGKSKENKIKKMCRSPQIFWLRPKKIIYFSYLFFPLCFIGSKKVGQMGGPRPVRLNNIKLYIFVKFIF